jgi:MscS family membrane protein
MFVIPNAVFSKNIVLNVTRKGREWRLLETIYIRVQDVQKVSMLLGAALLCLWLVHT